MGVIKKCAEVAQPGRALDSVTFVAEGEAEDRVVACSNPALGTTPLIWISPRHFLFSFPEESGVVESADKLETVPC